MARKDLGYRRVQSTGRGSYIISLPKNWIRDLGLKKGSEIAFNLDSDSTITLIPRKIKEKIGDLDNSKLKEYYIKIKPDEEDLYPTLRMIKALYVISADIIRIRFIGAEDTTKSKNKIKKFTRNALLGAEIINETRDEIVLQTLIKHSEFPIEKAVRRMAIIALSANRDTILALMAIIALSANRDTILALKNQKKEFFESVINARNDANRLGLYIVRQLKFGISRNMFRELGFKTPKEFLLYRIIVNDLKNITENALNIINNLANLKKQVDEELIFMKESLDEEVYLQILNFNSKAHELFEETMKAMFKRGYNDAEKVIAKRGTFIPYENELIRLMTIKKLDPNTAVIFRLVMDSSRRILDYSQDIAELTLNRTVEEICTSFEIKENS
jgi:phosphate uptake regulator